MTPVVSDVKAALTEGLAELRLPTVRQCYEEARQISRTRNTQL